MNGGGLLGTLLGITIFATALGILNKSALFAWEGAKDLKHRTIPKGQVNFWQ